MVYRGSCLTRLLGLSLCATVTRARLVSGLHKSGAQNDPDRLHITCEMGTAGIANCAGDEHDC